MGADKGRLKGNLWLEELASGGADTLVLIHGLGANGAVWDNLLPYIHENWSGRCLQPDLRGHGLSRTADNYSFGAFAADLAECLAGTQRIGIIGHSLGGALGALLASGWFGIDVRCVLAASVKTVWTEAELVKFAQIAQQPVRWMSNEAEARDRYLRAAGLQGHLSADARVVDRGIRYEAKRGYRFSADPKTIGSTGSQVDVLIRSALCPVRFVTGAQDCMAPAEQMSPFDQGMSVIEGAGHNIHVERPDEIWRLFQELWNGVEADQTNERKVG
jgi:pimeloyl-ACP methyl ester carboxylesterase